jgi:hypothetical protein
MDSDARKSVCGKPKFQLSAMQTEPTTTFASQFNRRLPIILVLIVFAATLSRLVAVVNRYSVNMIFWDQWDFYTPLFNRAPLWRIFTWEHAPIREGLGLVLDKFVLDATRWNTRAEALFMVAVLFLATIAALALKQKLYGRWSYSDVVIPCLILTFAQVEILIGEENPSYSVFPELLIILYCLAWTISKPILRYGSVVILNFLLIYTGFGFFMGPVTIGILILDLRREFRTSTSLRLPTAALVVALASQASFFYHYQWSTEISCPLFRAPIWQYPWFMALMMSYFFGLRVVVVASILGSAIALTAVAILAWHFLRLWRERQWSPIDLTIVILLAYTLFFQANSALGRVCLGMPFAAQFSRYMGLLVPAFLAIYLHVLTWRRKRTQAAALILLLLALIPSTLQIPAGYSPQAVHDGKAAWQACILQVGQIDYCDRATNFPVYPFARKTNLLEKLQFLQENRFNLYSGDR